MQPAAKTPDTLLAQYEREGYCIQPGALVPDECAQLIAAAKELKGFKTGITRPAMMPHRENAIFLQAMKKPNVVAMMERLLDGRVSGLQTEFFYCKPGTRGFSLHQDNFYVEAPTGMFGSVWIALTDTTPEKGGLIVYPGTQKEGDLPTRKIALAPDAGQDPNANNEECVVPPQYKALHARVPQGAGLYIHGHLVHGSNANATNEWRYVLLITYAREGVSFRPGKYAQRAPVNVYE